MSLAFKSLLLCCSRSGLELSLWVGELALSALDVWVGLSVFAPALVVWKPETLPDMLLFLL